MDVYLKGQRVRLLPQDSIGKGGEADIFDLGNGLAAKIFKAPNHPDFDGQPAFQQAAKERIAEHQKKLKNFPQGLPERVIAPQELLTDSAGNKILGYSMKFLKGLEVLLRYGERDFRQAGVSNEAVGQIFLDLHSTVSQLHTKQVVVGDFNDLNILVGGTEAYLIDADSFQFGGYLTKVFTAKFVDPLLCDARRTDMMLIKPHNPDSDWYAYAVMLMQTLLYVGPYGGIYLPKDKSKKIPHDARPLRRISVFDPEVRYPKPATPYGVLPDELLDHFNAVFVKDRRGIFPEKLLRNLRWTKCSKCSTIHARNICPECALAAPAAVISKTVIRGKVTATRVFETPGVILYASYQGGELKWLYHENNAFKREDKSTVIAGSLDHPQMRFRIFGEQTLIGQTSQFVVMGDPSGPKRFSVDNYGNLPIFDANSKHYYWLESGRLVKNGEYAAQRIGDVLTNQTMFWVGDDIGFGFYRAGELSIAFVFNAKSGGINDNVQMIPLRGQLIDSTAVFSSNRAWFFASVRDGGQAINHCMVVKSDGSVEATASATAGDGSWLSSIRGNCAAGNFLLVATDDGVVRVQLNGSRLEVVREFPDTEPFVDEHANLFIGKQGLYTVGRQVVYLLKID